jgi:hypothetical protein
MTIIINGSGQITGSDSSFQTGDFLFKMRATAPAGWIAADGSTIGAPGSGATRANDDTLALFTLWWTDFSDALLPILNSAGGASTRGVSAAADWAAMKRLTVFDARGRFPRAADSSANIIGSKQEDALQGHFHHVNVMNEAAGATVRGMNTIVTAQSPVSRAAGTSAASSLQAQTIETDNVNGTTRIASETRPRNIAMLPCFKL